ncbi:MAG: hypothetical protein IJV27_04780 [Prevotella sp.]|nr:hypothetical protein [Prevotella sp.]
MILRKTVSFLLVVAAMLCSSCATFTVPAAPQVQADMLRYHSRHELRGGIGIGSSQASRDRDRMTDGYLENYDLAVDGECFDIFGSIYLQAGVEYHYQLSRKWEVGALADWGLSRDSYSAYYGTAEPANPVNYGLANELCRFFVVAPSVRYTWYDWGECRYYSRLAFGAMRHHLTFNYGCYSSVGDPPADWLTADAQVPLYTDGTDKVKWRMAYQLTAIGVSLGSQSFNLFGELGYGCLGYVRVGVGRTF